MVVTTVLLRRTVAETAPGVTEALARQGTRHRGIDPRSEAHSHQYGTAQDHKPRDHKESPMRSAFWRNPGTTFGRSPR